MAEWLTRWRERRRRRALTRAARAVLSGGKDGVRTLTDMAFQDSVHARLQKTQATRALNASWEILTGSTKFTEAAGSGNWGSLSTKEQEEAYRNYALVRACVNLIVSAFQRAPLQVGTMDETGGFTPDPTGRNHWALRLLRRPNPEMTGIDVTQRDIANLLLTGSSYLWKWRSRMGKVVELWPLPTHWVTAKSLKSIDPDPASADKRRTISHYVIKIGGSGKGIPVATTDMVHRQYADPSSLTKSCGPFEAAYRPFKLDNDRANFFAELLENLYVPGPVMAQDEEPSLDQMRELKEALRDRIGPGKRGSPLFLWGKGARLDMKTPLTDLDWEGFSSLNESGICAAFGTPPLLVHARVAQKNTPLSSPSVKAASQVFYENTMEPLWIYSQESWTRELLLEEGEDETACMRHDTSKVEALHPDRDKVAAEVKDAVQASVMTLADGQRRLGLEPDPAFEGVYLLPLSMSPWKPGEEGSPPGAPAPPPPKELEEEAEAARAREHEEATL